MAKDNLSANGPHSVREINFDDIEIDKNDIVGKGSFGIVYKGVWENKIVAVKQLDMEERSFPVEIRQMSRVDHPNIIKLYACTRNPRSLVMEYAEGGSLYNVLHGSPVIRYNAGHAMSWCLQCAEGVAYLHEMRPKALIHRDLKPPNLLLDSTGKRLKICDFGTACDLKTYMSNSKGSPAWMAPEVFEGSTYTEKCDIFSWGIILWQVLSRQKPFNDVGGPAVRILWSVHQGRRPPLIQGCPKPLEILMTTCWSKNVSSRPSMREVVRVLSALFRFFPEHTEPLFYEVYDSSRSSMDEMNTEEDSRVSDIPESSLNSEGISGGINAPTNMDIPLDIPLNVDVNAGGDPWANSVIQQPVDALKCDSEFPDGVIPIVEDGSDHDSAPDGVNPSNEDCSDHDSAPDDGSDHDSALNDDGSEDDLESNATDDTEELADEFDDKLYLTLEPQLRPLEPEPTSKKSMKVFKEHKRLAKEYLEVQTEEAYLAQKLRALQEQASEREKLEREQRDAEERQKRRLEEEKESLLQYYSALKSKLEETKKKKNAQNNDWVMVPSNSEHPT